MAFEEHLYFDYMAYRTRNTHNHVLTFEEWKELHQRSSYQSRMRGVHAWTRSDRYGESAYNGSFRSYYEPRMHGNWNHPIPGAYAYQPEHHQIYYDHYHGHYNAGCRDQRQAVQIQPSHEPEMRYKEEKPTKEAKITLPCSLEVLKDILTRAIQEVKTQNPFISAVEKPSEPSTKESMESNDKVTTLDSTISKELTTVQGLMSMDTQHVEASLSDIQALEERIEQPTNPPCAQIRQIWSLSQICPKNLSTDFGVSRSEWLGSKECKSKLKVSEGSAQISQTKIGGQPKDKHLKEAKLVFVCTLWDPGPKIGRQTDAEGINNLNEEKDQILRHVTRFQSTYTRSLKMSLIKEGGEKLVSRICPNDLLVPKPFDPGV